MACGARALVDFLHESVHNKLTLLSAAAGYGKTALLAGFATETDYPLAWLSLGPDDRDLAGLLAHLVGALQAAFQPWSSGVLKVAAQAGATPLALANALALEIETNIDDYFVLVLDDFHLIDSEPAVMAFFDGLLVHLPAQAHLIVAGRTLPPFRYASLAAKQQISGLSEGQLRFTADETQALLQLRNQVEMPTTAAEALVANTEGWITGILLTTHLMWQGLMANLIEARQSERPLFEYLAAEVLEQQPPAIQQFLMESAVLPEMEAAVCDAVLGRTGSADLLRQALARRLFIGAVGDDPPAYQYHHLFRDFLQAELRRRAPDRLAEVQAGAARWFAAHAMPEAAVTFYVAAGELGLAAHLAEAEAKNLFRAGRHVTLRQWAEQLAAVADQVPRLFLFLASADSDLGQTARALAELDEAARGYQLRHNDNGRIGLVEIDLRRCWLLIRQGHNEPARALAAGVVAQSAELLPVASRAMGWRYLGTCQLKDNQVEAAEASLLTARRLLEGTEHSYDLAMLLADLALLYQQRGLPSKAALAQQEALALLRAEEAALPLANVLNNMGMDLHLLGQHETALSTYAEALQWARRAGSAETERLIWEGQASLLADLGEAAQAASLYHQALAVAEGAGERELLVYLACGLARLDRRAGHYAGALEWLRRAQLYLDGRALILPLTNISGLNGMIQFEMGHTAEGLAALRAACAAQAGSGALVDLAQSQFYLALAEFRQGAPAAGAAALTEAFSVAERIGYDQMLLREVPLARDVLESLRQHPTLGVRVCALLGRAGAIKAVRRRLIERGLLATSDPAPAAAPGLDVRTLGVAQVFKDGVEIPRSAWEAQRPRELFFYLVERMPLSKETVLAAFWPEMSQGRAVANLYQTLYRQRRALGREVIVLEEGECRLAPDLDLTVDAQEFEAQARQALTAAQGDLRRMDALAAATGLYQGDYLPEIDAPWAAARRLTLRDLHLKVVGKYVDELLRFTRYGEARTILARALVSEPLHDDLHGRMLICLAALGRRHEVVDHYRRYREMLRSELGLDPPSEIRQLYARLIE